MTLSQRFRALLNRITSLRHQLGFVTRKELVTKLVQHTAMLALKKGEHRELPAVTGVWGVIRVEGNTLPRFTYYVFDTPKMEFVTVVVDLALPDKVTFTCTTEDLGPIKTLGWYCKPFYRLARQLFQYYPLLPDYEDAPVRPCGPVYRAQQITKEEGQGGS